VAPGTTFGGPTSGTAGQHGTTSAARLQALVPELVARLQVLALAPMARLQVLVLLCGTTSGTDTGTTGVQLQVLTPLQVLLPTMN